VKRIIFGVGDSGKNTVLFQGAPRLMGVEDEELQASSEAAGERVYLGWAASALDGSTDDYAAEIQDFHFKLSPGETRFLRVEIAPGAESPMHRTPHINDYLVAISGELTFYTEDGVSTKFAVGDMLVQLAGWHSWRNEGAEPFVMAGVIIGIETDEDVPFGVEIAKSGD
jgi:quercetin dioxygenase-like cupin family protein